MVQTVTLQAKLHVTLFFKVIQYGYENFQNVVPALQNKIAKNIKPEANFMTVL